MTPMKWRIGIISVFVAAALPLFAAVSAVGKINGQPVFKDDLKRIPESQDSSLSAFDRLVLFRLAIDQAKKERLERTPNVKYDLELVLYRHFLENRLKSASQHLVPTDSETRIYYEQHPLLRLRHLVLRFSSPSEQQLAGSSASKVEALFRAGSSFSSVAEEYSQDETAPIGGDIGERGIHNLHEDFYLKLTQLQPGDVSPRIESRTGLHFFQVTSRIPFQSVQPQYLTFLNKKLSQDREQRFLNQVLNDLKRNARIEVTQSAKNE